jgi:antirestriction protein ArdC
MENKIYQQVTDRIIAELERGASALDQTMDYFR